MTKTIQYDFDSPVERRGTGCAKWGRYGDDVIPMWVADMDFQVPPAVQEALHERVEHGIFGYTMPPPNLKALLVERMQALYDWAIAEEDIVFSPGVIPGVNMSARAVAHGGAMLIQPPVYPPFFKSSEWSDVTLQEAPLTRLETDDGFTYTVDLDAFEAAITPETRMFLLCSPHNPVGRVWTRDELASMAEICLRHDVVICSDEIHNDLLLGDAPHVPIATISPEIADHTITLMAPSKTFNIPALGFSFAIIQNETLRNQFVQSALGLITAQMGGHNVSFMNMMGYTAAEAAYRHGGEWLQQAMDYVRENRDYTRAYMAEHMPSLQPNSPEGTFLMWVDCAAADLPEPPAKWFLENARVAFNEGSDFGEEGAGYIRVNLACPRSTLEAALERMREALANRD